jgi:ABC-type antimicrobial peptide transport system permease subunit
MLGVVIGVGSVIAMIGIGEGTKKKSLSELEVMGSNRITIMPNWGRGGGRDANAASTLRPEDVDRIRRFVPAAKYVTGVVSSRFSGQSTVKFGSKSKRTGVTGAEPVIRFIDNSTKMHSGAWWDDADNELMERKDVPVAVIVSEYVDIAKAFYVEDEPKLVNAVLDRVSRRVRGEGRGKDAL